MPDLILPGRFQRQRRRPGQAGRSGTANDQGAAHLGFVILVSTRPLVAETLGPVYAALGLDFNSGTVGSIEDARRNRTRRRGAGAARTALSQRSDFNRPN